MRAVPVHNAGRSLFLAWGRVLGGAVGSVFCHGSVISLIQNTILIFAKSGTENGILTQ